MVGVNKKKYDCYNVHYVENDYSFLHIEIEDNDIFYKKLFHYFFNEDKLLQYAENNFRLKFSANSVNYTKLYKNLKYFIDQKNSEEILKQNAFDEMVTKILSDELIIENKEGKNYIRIDKFGKVGEYIFSCILSDFFKLDCIIPKVKLTTSFNMCAYGIDTLFYSSEDNIIYFGESKISKTLDNGISLIKTSLKEYEKQIRDEFLLTLSNRVLNCNDKFMDKFKDYIDKCIDFNEFVNCAGINTIGIPIFIAHGYETLDINNIFIELQKLPKNQILGLKTVYHTISLPIINKDKMMAIFTKELRNKEEFYKNAR